MRPIHRGQSPRTSDFDDYREAYKELQSRLGPYCSYCERRIYTQLAVEHIQPKGLPCYAGLIGRWDNFLLGCVNCNSTKQDKDVLLDRTFLPDRDNTFAAFEYTPDGKVKPRATLSPADVKIARDTLALTGLDKRPKDVKDENGRLVAIERVGQRMEVWALAEDSRDILARNTTDDMRCMIVRLAVKSGFFSIWMQVFESDTILRGMLIKEFNAASDCFDPATKSVSPRPPNSLPHGGKI